MKIKSILYLLGLFSLTSHGAETECAKVAYIPFDISLYGSETEETIEKNAMRRKFIKLDGFESLVRGKYSSLRKGYMADNSKVFISFHEGGVFIDAKGRVRKGSEYADFDIERFESVLVDKCP